MPSIAGLLHGQLLQLLELTCGVQPFLPLTGDPFDGAHHSGTQLDGRAGKVRRDVSDCLHCGPHEKLPSSIVPRLPDSG